MEDTHEQNIDLIVNKLMELVEKHHLLRIEIEDKIKQKSEIKNKINEIFDEYGLDRFECDGYKCYLREYIRLDFGKICKDYVFSDEYKKKTKTVYINKQ